MEVQISGAEFGYPPLREKIVPREPSEIFSKVWCGLSASPVLNPAVICLEEAGNPMLSSYAPQ